MRFPDSCARGQTPIGGHPGEVSFADLRQHHGRTLVGHGEQGLGLPLLLALVGADSVLGCREGSGRQTGGSRVSRVLIGRPGRSDFGTQDLQVRWLAESEANRGDICL